MLEIPWVLDANILKNI